MPSSQRRIGYLPRKGVQEIVNQICTQKNLSQSKVIGILVEEALANRGLFNPTIGKEINQSSNIPIDEKASQRYKTNEEMVSDAGSWIELKNSNKHSSNNPASIEEEDLSLLAKIKSLKALGLL